MILGFLLGLACGMAIVIQLTRFFPSLRDIRWLISLTVAGLIIRLVLASLQDGLLWTGIAASCGFIAGYVAMTFLVLRPASEPALPPLSRTAIESSGPDAVVYFTHGEPETYDPEPWLHQFQEFDEGKIPFIPWVFRPLFLSMIRKHYARVGTSHHKQGHQAIIAALQAWFASRGDTKTRFYLSFLDDHPHPDVMAIQAANDGASRIIMLEVFLTKSNHTAEGENMVSKLGLDSLGMPILKTTPLWDSEPLAKLFVEKAVGACPDVNDRSSTGILLIGHGQPKSWDKEFPTETSQEAAFRERLRDHLVAAGFHAGNIASAWMQFREPGVVAEARSLAAGGIKRLLVFSAAISADSLHSQFDVPELINKAKLPSTIEILHLGAWNNHPRLVEALAEKITAALQ